MHVATITIHKHASRVRVLLLAYFSTCAGVWPACLSADSNVIPPTASRTAYHIIHILHRCQHRHRGGTRVSFRFVRCLLQGRIKSPLHIGSKCRSVSVDALGKISCTLISPTIDDISCVTGITHAQLVDHAVMYQTRCAMPDILAWIVLP